MFWTISEFRSLEASRQTKAATVNPAALWEFLQINISSYDDNKFPAHLCFDVSISDSVCRSR